MQKLNIPDNINSYTHKFFEHVRWGDTDGHNHVNNVSFSRYFESHFVYQFKDRIESQNRMEFFL